MLYTGAGIEYSVGTTTLFAEVEWRHFMDRNYDNSDGEDYGDIIRVVPGVLLNNDGFAIDVTGSFALTDFNPEWSDLGHGIFQSGGTPTVEERADRSPFPQGYAQGWASA